MLRPTRRRRSTLRPRRPAAAPRPPAYVPTGLPARLPVVRARGCLPHFLPAGANGGLYAGGRRRSLSGCTVTSYQPTRAWTYQVGYTPLPVAPCSGYSTSYSGCSSCGTACGCSSCGCSSCGTSYGGCSSCSAGVSSTYVTSGGCSSCTSSIAPRTARRYPPRQRSARQARRRRCPPKRRPDFRPRLACGADLARRARCDQRQPALRRGLVSRSGRRRGQPRRHPAADSRRAAGPRRPAT